MNHDGIVKGCVSIFPLNNEHTAITTEIKIDSIITFFLLSPFFSEMSVIKKDANAIPTNVIISFCWHITLG